MSETAKLFADGEVYERLMGRWSRRVGEGFLDWLNVPTGLQWLDVGCGNGAFTEELISRCAPAAVIAVDRPRPCHPDPAIPGRMQCRNYGRKPALKR